MEKIALIVDDDRTQRRLIKNALQKIANLNCIEAENGKDALRILRNHDDGNIALIMLDLEMPVLSGLEALPVIKQENPNIPVIILTANNDAEEASRTFEMGAIDFLSKPLQKARLDVSVKNALQMATLSKELSRITRREKDQTLFTDLIGHNNGLKESVAIAKKAAACDLPVLVTGETGTGKEVFSRAIHGESKRMGQPFIAVNCGAIPENLVESTLFGHEKGSFTGAINKAPGKFLEADGGTIFLDEIGELPLAAQVKLLRALQEGEVEPVGAARPVPINVRIISATNRDLRRDVKDGRFREDLYFRLNVIHINLPSLRARTSDIPAIAEFVMTQFCSAHQMGSRKMTAAAIDKLRQYDWPGNVRELENVINRTLALNDCTTIQPEHFTFLDAVTTPSSQLMEGAISTQTDDGSFKSFKALEAEIMTLALHYNNHNMAKTARVLGIAKSTLYAKIEAIKAENKI